MPPLDEEEPRDILPRDIEIIPPELASPAALPAASQQPTSRTHLLGQ